MKLFIPEIGTEIRLTKGWKFPLHFEYRNESLGKCFGIKAPDVSNTFGYVYKDGWNCQPEGSSTPMTLPKGTILKVDRIYICKASWGGDAKKFSSVTFYATIPNTKGRKPRFWAKLRDVNNIVGDIITNPLEETDEETAL